MNFLSSLDALASPTPSTTPRGFGAGEASDLFFADVEPGEGQRWTTWPATTPTERGPQPRPDWLVTSAGAIDTELGVVKTGKEAELYLIERAVPGAAPGTLGEHSLLAAKRYRGSEHSDFTRSSIYTDGRNTRRSRDRRAIENRSTFGRSVARVQWASTEFNALCELTRLGAAVPYPVQLSETEVLMEFIGEGRVAAPRLAQTRATPSELRELFHQIVDFMHTLAAAGLAHGDLSPYNMLVDRGRVVVIDLPQVVDVIANPGGLELLHRDCVNVCEWFTRQQLECDAEELFGELVGMLHW